MQQSGRRTDCRIHMLSLEYFRLCNTFHLFAHFHRDKKVKVVWQMGIQQATVHHHHTFVEPKKSSPYVVIALPALHYNCHGQHIRRTSAFMQVLQMQTSVSWNFWLVRIDS